MSVASTRRKERVVVIVEGCGQKRWNAALSKRLSERCHA